MSYLKEYFFDEEYSIHPLNENENGDGSLIYKITLDGKKYKLKFDVNKSPTKKGIKVKFFPLDNEGNEVINPSDEQLAMLQNDIAVKLAPKFNDFRLELDEDADSPEPNVAAFQIPLSSFVSFVANVVFKR